MRHLAFISALLASLLVPAAPGFASGDWAWPVRGQVLTEFRNGDDPYAAGQHRGIDIAAAVGTPVVAAASGTVVFAGVVGSSGLVVSERSGDGRHELSYLHLSAVSVRRGQAVERGDSLGAAGVSGTRSVAQPHLHFGVREAADRHAYLDPLLFLAPPPADTPEPRPVPVPAAEPVSTAPLPAPLPAAVPSVAPAPEYAAAPHATGPHVVAHPAPALPGHGAPGHAPAAHASPSSVGWVARGPHHAPAARPPLREAPAPEQARRPARGPGVAAAEPGGATAASRAPAHQPHRGGIDRAWLAACAGLVLAAALLAAPRRDDRPRRPARAAFGALMRAASRP